MIEHVGRIFALKREEVTPASLLFLYLFVTLGVFVTGQSVGNALFMGVFPHHLPFAMMGAALLTLPFATLYVRLSHRLRLEPLIVATLLFFASCFVLFWWIMRHQLNWVYMLLYIWVQTFGVMGPMMGWTLANYLLTTREARRVFGFIQIGAILGVPSFGFPVHSVLDHKYAKPETLILVLGLLVVVCAVLVKLLFRNARERLAFVTTGPLASKEAPKTFGQSVTHIKRSRYLQLVTLLITVGCLTSCIVQYQFILISNDSFTVGAKTDKVALAAFFANFTAYMGLGTMLLQLVMTGPLLRKFGIRVSLFVLPLALLLPTGWVLLDPRLLTAGLMRGTHYLLRYSVDKSSAELLYLPVAPEVKSQVKSFIDTFIWRSTDGIAGALMIMLTPFLKRDLGRVSVVSLLLLGGWIVVAFAVRREYLNVLRRAIERRTLEPERIAASLLDSTTTEVLAHGLEHAGEQQALYGLSLFEIGRQPAWHPALRRLLDHPSPTVRQRALHLLSEAGDRGIAPQVEKLIGDASLEVRTEALRYLVVHMGQDPLELLKAEHEFPDYAVQGSVVAYLARTGEPGHLPAARLMLESMLTRSDEAAGCARTEAAQVLGLIPPPSELHGELPKLLSDPDLKVVEQALMAAGHIRSREFLPLVIENLTNPKLRTAARAALVLYGDRAVGTLKDYLNDPAVPMGRRKEIPLVLSRISTIEAGLALTESLIQSDPGLRYEVLKGLNKLCRQDRQLLPETLDFADMLDAELMGYYRSFQILAAIDPQAGASAAVAGETHEASLVAMAVRERMDHEFERIFRLLALLYPCRDVHNAYVGLTSHRPHLRANALEVLENMLKPDLYKRLAYSLDPEIKLAEKLRFAERFCHTKVDSAAEALRVLLHSGDNWLRACALYAVGKLELVELAGELRSQPRDGGELVEETWAWAARRLEARTAP